MAQNSNSPRQLSFGMFERQTAPSSAPAARTRRSRARRPAERTTSDIEPTPMWETENRDHSHVRPDTPAEPLCSSRCGFREFGVRGELSRCTHPERRQAETAEEHSPCWPVYYAMWRRAFVTTEAK